MPTTDLGSIWTPILIAVGAFAGFWLLITASGSFPILLLWYSKVEYQEDPRPAVSRAIKTLGKEWLIEAGFEPAGAVAPLGIRMALFLHRSGHTAMAVYFMGGKVITDMYTVFPNRVRLNTANSIDGVAAPPTPRSIVQCLPSHGLARRWQMHVEAAKLLRDELKSNGEPIGDLAEDMRDSTDRHARFLFTRPWVLLTIPYRYFVTRARYRDVTIAEQLDKQWIDAQALSELVHSPTPIQ